jgi:hypothetical protein
MRKVFGSWPLAKPGNETVAEGVERATSLPSTDMLDHARESLDDAACAGGASTCCFLGILPLGKIGLELDMLEGRLGEPELDCVVEACPKALFKAFTRPSSPKWGSPICLWRLAQSHSSSLLIGGGAAFAFDRSRLCSLGRRARFVAGVSDKGSRAFFIGGGTGSSSISTGLASWSAVYRLVVAGAVPEKRLFMTTSTLRFKGSAVAVDLVSADGAETEPTVWAAKAFLLYASTYGTRGTTTMTESRFLFGES